MNAAEWALVKAAFDECLDAPPAARPALLERAFPGEPGLRGEVVSLLEAHGGAGHFLAAPALGQRDAPPRRMGAWELLEEIGTREALTLIRFWAAGAPASVLTEESHSGLLHVK